MSIAAIFPARTVKPPTKNGSPSRVETVLAALELPRLSARSFERRREGRTADENREKRPSRAAEEDVMPTRRLLAEAQRSRLSALLEMDARELVRHHTLSEADLTAVGVRRGAANRLGFAVQLCLLRYLGRP